MVHKIIQSRFNVFLEAFLMAASIFIIAFALGLYIESSRTNNIINNYKTYEIQGLDFKLQSYYFQTMTASTCDLAVKHNFEFADQVYSSAIDLERAEGANQITDDLILEKQRHTLLRTELWLNTLQLKSKCGYPFDTVVYFYYGDPRTNKAVSEQKIISNVLKEVKERFGYKMILIPIAGDFNLDSVNLQMESYNVTQLPAVLINEKTVLYGFHSAEEIESYVGR